MSTDQLATVNSMLDAAGLDPSPEERVAFSELYSVFKGGIDLMYALPEAKYELPALVFDAQPELTEW